MNNLNISIAGLGNVGSALVQLIEKNAKLIQYKSGLNINIIGGLYSLFGVIVLGAFIFLCIGFFLGSLAKTQEAIRPIALLFTLPQLILSGIFFPISSLPALIQPIAQALPLSVIASSMRDIANDGISLFTINFNLIGILAWMIISFFIATKFFDWQKVAS